MDSNQELSNALPDSTNPNQLNSVRQNRDINIGRPTIKLSTSSSMNGLVKDNGSIVQSPCGSPTRDSGHTKQKCLVIYTGGTFGMAPDAEGVLHPCKGFLAQKIRDMDEFQFPHMPVVTVSEWSEPIDSSDMSPEEWCRLAHEIEENYWDYDGFVVLHGTDTMAYTASALSFMLEYLGKPVVLSGAMIPLHFPHSDGRRNLIMSVICASTLAIPEVCIYSNDKLLRGNRTTKIANMTVDAFQSPNFPALAATGVETTVDQHLILPYPRRRFQVCTKLHTNICVFHLIPGFDDDCINSYVDRCKRKANGEDSKAKKAKYAIVLALYGTGNAPLRKNGFLNVIAAALAVGITVVVTTQCVQGRTQLSTYATGEKLLKMGVITSLDMTIEATVTKLAYLIGKGFTGEQLKARMESELRGELSVVDSVANGEELSHAKQNRKTVIQNFMVHQ